MLKKSQKDGLLTFAKADVKEGKGFPRSFLATGAFENEHMDMGVPLQIATEGMETADDTWSEGFLFVLAGKPAEDSMGRGLEKQMEQMAIKAEVVPEHIGNGKDGKRHSGSACSHAHVFYISGPECNMLINFDEIEEVTIPHLNGGDGAVSAKMFMDPDNKIMISRLPAGTSIGLHKHTASSEMNFVLSGTGTAICDKKEEKLSAGVCQYCPKGSAHSILNTGTEDLVLFPVVSEQ